MSDLNVRTVDDLEKFTVYYHNLFDFPLNFSELIKWTSTGFADCNKRKYEIICDNGYCFVAGRKGLLYKRVLRKRYSERKMLIAKKAAKMLSKVQAIKMIAVSGSLAMENAVNNSDIDLFIITKKNKLWSIRLLAYLMLKIFDFSVRTPEDIVQKDKLCLNMWFDESDLIWKNPRNPYTAHEIAQLIPLINKDKTYEKLLYQNRWILKYWPKAVKIRNFKSKINNSSLDLSLIEKLAFKLQYMHMKSRISREVITPTRAIFHPKNWSKIILTKLNN